MAVALSAACSGGIFTEESPIFVSDAYVVYNDSLIIFPDSIKVFAPSQLELQFVSAAADNWKADSITRALPVYASDQTIVNALYNRGARIITEQSSTLRSAQSRYAIESALAIAAPDQSMKMLENQTSGDRVAILPGAGGGWPVVADRASWITAAWKVYLVTGDRKWLAKAYRIARNTLDEDEKVLLSPAYGLMHGIPLPIDGRSLYPLWMSGSDLYSTMSLTANVNYAGALAAAAQMAEEIGENPGHYNTMFKALTSAINERLWIPDAGYYSQYLYGSPYPILSQATDNLGQALCVVYGVARQEWAAALMRKTPRYNGWIPRIYPQMTDSAAIDSVIAAPPIAEVLTYWTRAAAASLPGDALNMAVGSQLACLAVASPDDQLRHSIGLASTLYHVIAGMHFERTCLRFAPVVPSSMPGTKWISGIRFREATLDIAIRGTGRRIRKFTVDGEESHSYSIDSKLKGHHTIEITLDDHTESFPRPIVVKPSAQPATPKVDWTSARDAVISDLQNNLSYKIFLNDDFRDETTDSVYKLYEARNFTTVYIIPFNSKTRLSGYSPRPHHYFPPTTCFSINATRLASPGSELPDKKDEDYGKRVIELTPGKNTSLKFDVVVSIPGNYFVDVRYTNGSGPRLSGKKCAIRTLSVNGVHSGTIVMAQQGNGRWAQPSFSNPVEVRFNRGRNTVAIEYIEPYNINGDRIENNALIEYIRFIRK